MNDRTQLEYLKDFVVSNRFKDVLHELNKLISDETLEEELLVISSQFNDLDYNERLGLLNFEQINTLKNNLRLSLIKLIHQLEYPDKLSIDTKEKRKDNVKRTTEINVKNSNNIVVGNKIRTKGNIRINK